MDRRIAIRAHGLSKQRGGRMVLRAVDLAVPAGQCLELAGANGAGKTTLLRCLAGAMRPTAGRVWWFGQLAAEPPAARRLVGTVAHETQLYRYLTLRENLIFAARMYGVGCPKRRADQLLEQAGLAAFADRRPPEVSRGLRQRAAIARSLVHRPRILLWDEPLAGLDAQGVGWLLGLFRELREAERTICFVSHGDRAICGVADRILELHGGCLRQPPRPDAYTERRVDAAVRASAA